MNFSENRPIGQVGALQPTFKLIFCFQNHRMERRTQFNIGYLLFAVVAILALQQWWQRAQTVEVLPYSEFEKLLAEHKVDEVVISDQRITGKLTSKQGGKTVAVANLVAPDLAERLSKN